jgi:DNA-binding CsgD family transcriptional regulator
MNSGDEVLSPGEFARIAADELSAIPFPALVLETASERIVAATPAATLLLDPGGNMIVGHLLEAFTADRPAQGPDLFAGGRLDGFETFRVLRRPHGADLRVRMWIRPFGSTPASQLVVVVLVADQRAHHRIPAADWEEAPAVVGTTDAALMIERVSSDAEELFNRPVSELVGTSFSDLVAKDDLEILLAGLNDAVATQNGITLYLSIRATAIRPALRCEVLLLPMQPSPSCAFVFLPTPDDRATGMVARDLSEILLRLGRGAEMAQLARGVFRGISEHTLPGLSRLTTRELEVVAMLVDGERPPAIAQKLSLSQSTIRNHLASVFGKVGVTSQQALTDLVRKAQSDIDA